MTLTVIAEDHQNPEMPDLQSDHGFSLLADINDQQILYDFGSADSLENNSRILGIDLEKVDRAFLSHGHYDHSGGMEAFLKANSRATITHGRGAFQPRWSVGSGAPKDVGISMIPTDKVVDRLTAVDTMVVEDSYVILPAAPGHHERPAGNERLLAGPEGSRLPDDFTDELILALKTEDGLVVVSGCSHRGILNIVDQVKTYCPKCPIRALIGGFHLVDKYESEENIVRIAEKLKEALPQSRIFTGHCTGDKAMGILSERLGGQIQQLHVGMKLSF